MLHVWSTITGPFEVICDQQGTHDYSARLRLQQPGTGIPGKVIPGVVQGGAFVFHIAGADLQVMQSGNGRLLLMTRHVITPDAPDPRWGWRYRLRQGQQPLSAVGSPGNQPVARDAQGFFNSALQQTGNVGTSRQFIRIG